MEQSTANPVLLTDRPGRTIQSRGASALASGSLFAVAGFAAGWFALRSYLSGGAQALGDVRTAFLVLFAALFVLVGLFHCAQGVRDLAGEARRKRATAAQPDQPWLGDYAWSPEGARFSGLRETAKQLTTAMIGTLVVAPFAWIALQNPTAWAFDLFVAILAVIPAYAWWKWLAALRAALQFRGGFLRYETFPFFAGSTLRASLEVERNLASMLSLTLTLRCVEEKYISSESRRWGGSPGLTVTQSYELFKQVLVLDRSQIVNSPGGEVAIQFSLPAEAPPAQLSSRPPTYWEIESIGTREGGTFHARFLVPVYRRRP